MEAFIHHTWNRREPSGTADGLACCAPRARTPHATAPLHQHFLWKGEISFRKNTMPRSLAQKCSFAPWAAFAIWRARQNILRVREDSIVVEEHICLLEVRCELVVAAARAQPVIW